MRRVLITGASRGLGRALCSLFIERGDEVLALSKSGEALPGARSLRADLSDPAAVHALAADLFDRFPSIDILIHNAGIAPGARLHNAEEADFDRAIMVNFTAGRVLSERLRDRLKGGLVIFILSRVGFEGRIGLSGYAVSKGLLAGYVAGAAQDFSQDKIRIWGVNPGFMKTGMVTDPIIEAQAAASLLHAALPPENAAMAIVALCGLNLGSGFFLELDSRTYGSWGR